MNPCDVRTQEADPDSGGAVLPFNETTPQPKTSMGTDATITRRTRSLDMRRMCL